MITKTLNIAFLFLCLHSFAQQKVLHELKLGEVTAVSVDRLGNFYFVTKNGSINKYNPEGKLLAQSAPNRGHISLLEAWNPLRVFAYYANNNSYHIFDHTLELLEIKKIDPVYAVTPKLACPGNEPYLWILDGADYSLKKINTRNDELILESGIDSVTVKRDLAFMREYQNYLFIADANEGILMLNNIGKIIKSIPLRGVHYFNFLGEELCYREKDKLKLFDLYTAETRTVFEIPDWQSVMYTIITDERIVTVRPDSIKFYKLTLH